MAHDPAFSSLTTPAGRIGAIAAAVALLALSACAEEAPKSDATATPQAQASPALKTKRDIKRECVPVNEHCCVDGNGVTYCGSLISNVPAPGAQAASTTPAQPDRAQ